MSNYYIGSFFEAKKIFSRMAKEPDLEDVAEDFLAVLEQNRESRVSEGILDRDEAMGALNDYFRSNAAFRAGFDRAMLMLAGWGTPKLLEMAWNLGQPAE